MRLPVLALAVLAAAFLVAAPAAQAQPYPGFTADPTPLHPFSYITQIVATSATNAWALYGDEDPGDAGILHRTASGWQVVGSCGGEWQDISAVTDNDVWFVGSADPENQSKQWIDVAHWNGTAWHCYRPHIASDTESIHARAGDVWVTVTYFDAAGVPPAFAHWHQGQGWEVFTQTCGDETYCVASMDSAGGVIYAAGRTWNADQGDSQAGVWTRCQSCS